MISKADDRLYFTTVKAAREYSLPKVHLAVVVVVIVPTTYIR